jgi:predicted glutamine amidotransferase
VCELLGLSSNRQTTINLSLAILAQRGEAPDLNGDGWGVAFYEGNDVRLLKDAGPAKDSAWVDFIREQQISSHDIIAHIRKATVGEIAYRNTQPYIRELHGRIHTLAHNGTLRKIKELDNFQHHLFHPVGDTDSEWAFCVLMDRMSAVWNEKDLLPSLQERTEIVSEFASSLREMGPANFLYSDGDAVFAHGHRRVDPRTEAVISPALYYIQRFCQTTDEEFLHSEESGVALRGENDLITLFASVPLNEEKWIPLKEGQLVVVQRGKIKHIS